MPGFERGLYAMEVLLAAAAVSGLVVRRRAGGCRMLVALLLSVIVFEGLIAAWPDRFFNWRFWLTRETTQAVIQLALLLEIMVLALRPFGRARALARIGLAAPFVAGAAGIIAVQATDAVTLGQVVVPRVLYGTALAFAGLLAVVLWFRIPLDQVHKAVLMTLTPYLVLFTIAIHSLRSFGVDVRASAGYLNISAALAMFSWWTWVAWRPQKAEVGVSSDVVRRLQPWRV